MKKFAVILMIVFMGFYLTACNSSNNGMLTKDNKKVAMVADVGTINDNSFNQSAWEGLKDLRSETGVEVSYLNSTQASDYRTNLEQLTDDDNDLIWGIGYVFADCICDAAKANPLYSYAIADYVYSENQPDNVTGVGFKSEEPSFLVGYIAGKTTKTNKVGFIGGMRGIVVSQFQCGFRAGVKYAAKELGKNIEVVEQYAETFTDSSVGKAIGLKMYSSQNCDIIFHAAGHVGIGLIEVAKELNKYAIGVDRDQSYLAPNNVLTSALKNVNTAVKQVSKKMLADEGIGGKNYIFGIKEGCAGIPTENKNVSAKVFEDTLKVQDKIISEELVVPSNEEKYKEFLLKYNI